MVSCNSGLGVAGVCAHAPVPRAAIHRAPSLPICLNPIFRNLICRNADRTVFPLGQFRYLGGLAQLVVEGGTQLIDSPRSQILFDMSLNLFEGLLLGGF